MSEPPQRYKPIFGQSKKPPHNWVLKRGENPKSFLSQSSRNKDPIASRKRQFPSVDLQTDRKTFTRSKKKRPVCFGINGVRSRRVKVTKKRAPNQRFKFVVSHEFFVVRCQKTSVSLKKYHCTKTLSPADTQEKDQEFFGAKIGVFFRREFFAIGPFAIFYEWRSVSFGRRTSVPLTLSLTQAKSLYKNHCFFMIGLVGAGYRN